jgi:hypothetical protein
MVARGRNEQQTIISRAGIEFHGKVWSHAGNDVVGFLRAKQNQIGGVEVGIVDLLIRLHGKRDGQPARHPCPVSRVLRDLATRRQFTG